MIKIRLHGTKAETAEFAEMLQNLFTVYSVSEPYKDRGTSQYYRIYLDVDVMTVKAEATTIELPAESVKNIKE